MDWEDISDTEIEQDMPTKIIVVKSIAYDVDNVVEAMMENGFHGIPEVNDILQVVVGWAVEDFGCEWGHHTSLSSLSFFDEDGGEYVLTREE